MRIIKNNTGDQVFIRDIGITIEPDGSYPIPAQDYLLWSASQDAVTAIVSRTIIVNDGERNLDRRVGIALLQNNPLILMEHYSLNNDDSLLFGNGSILFSKDILDSTDNVPSDIDLPTTTGRG
jgi:hypothetical protein